MKRKTCELFSILPLSWVLISSPALAEAPAAEAHPAFEPLKISGYIQSRYEWHDDANFGLDAAGKPLGTNRFFVRRGRLKAVHATANAEYLLQIDATGDGVVVKDAEATFIDTWTPLKLHLTMGQFKVPFGYEILQSSGEREMPERSLVIRKLFPGERDRGLRLKAQYGHLRFNGAVINGNAFTTDSQYGTFDQTSFKDLVGRVGAEFGFVTLGVSGHWGHELKTTSAKAATAAVPAMPASYDNFSRLRVGADAQVYAVVPKLGKFALKGEIIWARDKNIEFSGVAANPCKDATAFGWYLTMVQDLGTHLGVVVRVDQFDPNTSANSSCPDTVTAPAAIDRVTTVGGGLLVPVSANLRGTLVYEHLAEQGVNSRGNDVFTAQLQAKF